MQKLPKHCAAVLGRVIFIGFGIQIVLGIFWMCNAFVRQGSPGGGIICVCQMAALGAAVYFFAGTVRGRLFTVLSVLTFPMILQCLALPDTRVWATVLLLAESGCALRAVGRRENRGFWYAGLCAWFAAALLRGEYLYFGAVPMVFSWLYDCMRFSRNRGEGEDAGRKQGAGAGQDEDAGRRQRRNELLYRLLLLCAVAGLAAGIGSFYQVREKLTTHLAGRVAWTTLYNTYSDLPKETKALIKYRDMVNSTYEATGIEMFLRPSLEERLGEQETENVLRALMKTAWQNHKGQILKEITWDMAGYLLTPAVLPLQLRGRAYESYSGNNYLQILKPAPKLGKLYMEYGCKWFIVSLALGLLTGFAVRAKRRMSGGCVSQNGSFEYRTGMLSVSAFVIPFLTALTMSAVYTLSGAGRMDYKNTLFVLCVWVLWTADAGARGVAGGKPDEEER